VRCGWERSPREHIIGGADRRTEEDSVMNTVIEATTDNGFFAVPEGSSGRYRSCSLPRTRGASERGLKRTWP
jgi:hypothetical protein